MGIVFLVKLNVANVEEMKEKRDVKGLITALQSTKDVIVRRDAEKALGDIGDKSAVVPLIQALNDEDSDIRFEAAEALGKLKSANAAEPLVQALKDEASTVREGATAALLSIGTAAVAPLVQALKGEESTVRMRAADVLDKLGWTPRDDSERAPYLIAKQEWNELAILGEPAEESLIQALEDKDSEVRMRAAEALGVLGCLRAIGPLIQALKDEYWNVNKEAEKALGVIGEPAVEHLIQALKDERWGVRKRAAGTLGRIQNKKGVAPLIYALKDKHSEVRKAAAKALDKLGWKPEDTAERVHYLIATEAWDELAKLGESALEPLIQALQDENSTVQIKAAEALGRIGDARAIEPLIQALKDNYWDVNKKAAEALGRIGDARAVEPLIQALDDERWEVRWGAARALGEIGDKSALKTLVPALKDKDIKVRKEVAEALGTMGEPAVGPLIQTLEDTDGEVREKAAKALGKMGDARAVGPLFTALHDSKSEVRKKAAKALDKLAWKPGDDSERVRYLIAKKKWADLVTIGASAVKPLIQALEDTDSKVRKGAAEALGKIGDTRAVGPLVHALKYEITLPSSRPSVQKAMRDALAKLEGRR
jgi:HEAT repeat protein